jgi:hypothetical protein
MLSQQPLCLANNRELPFFSPKPKPCVGEPESVLFVPHSRSMKAAISPTNSRVMADGSGATKRAE